MNRLYSIGKIPLLGRLLQERLNPLKTTRIISLQRLIFTFNPGLSIVKVRESSPTSMFLEFQDGIRGDLSYIWLRDNCRCEACYDSDRQLKAVDTIALEERVRPEYIVSEDRDLKIVWLENPQHVSLYPPEWLHKYLIGFYNYRHFQVHDVLPPVVTWNSETLGEGNLYLLYDELMTSETAVDQLIGLLYTYGIACVVGAPCNEDEVLGIVDKFNAASNSPRTFSFDIPKTPALKQGLQNLEFHNGLNYRMLHPGIQAVHCLSIFNDNRQRMAFVDGFEIAKWMKNAHPEDYHILSTTPVKFKYVTPGLEYVSLQTVIKPNEVEGLSEIHYDNQTMTSFEGPVDEVLDFYKSYRIFGKRLRREEYQHSIDIRPGDVVIYNNRRILHRWDYFEPDLVSHFSGCYGDFDLLVAQFRQIIKTSF